jgi:YggT family protein
MLYQAFSFLWQTLFGFFILNLLMRFYFQVARVSFRHPLGEFVLAITNWAVLPTRRLIPSVGGYDSASLLLAWISSVLMYGGLWLFTPFAAGLSSLAGIFLLLLQGLLGLMQTTVYLIMGAVLVQAILSWVAPYNPLGPLLDTLTKPLLKPLRNIIPPIGNVDLSPFVLLILLQLVQMVLLTYFERRLFSQFMMTAF